MLDEYPTWESLSEDDRRIAITALIEAATKHVGDAESFLRDLSPGDVGFYSRAHRAARYLKAHDVMVAGARKLGAGVETVGRWGLFTGPVRRKLKSWKETEASATDTNGWRSVKHPPPHGVQVLVHLGKTSFTKVIEGLYDSEGEHWVVGGLRANDVTAWRPLPGPPTSTAT